MKWVAYYRVSTRQQGKSGLGLEAQRSAVRSVVAGDQLIAEYTEVESGKRNDRPQLVAALDYARLTGSKLIVAKLDRLSRNAAFLLALQNSGVDFICADNPTANSMTIGILAVVAQEERKMIGTRTREALAAAKARGVVLGGDRGKLVSSRPLARQRSIEVRQTKAAARRAQIMPHIEAARAGGVTTLQALADYLNGLHIKTPRGGLWHPASVSRLLDQ